MIEKERIAYGCRDLCSNLITDSWTDLEWVPKTQSGRKILDSSSRDNIFLDQDLNYFMLSMFLFVEPHTVNSTEIWPLVMFKGLEMNIRVFQVGRLLKYVIPVLSSPSVFFFWRLTSLFIKTDPASCDQMKNSSLNYKFVHPGPLHNYVIAQTASNSPAEEAWHRQAK